MRLAEAKRPVKFGLIGAIGFVFDGGILTLLSQTFSVNVYLSRLISFAIACSVTWLLNRWLVFQVERSSASKTRREYGRYFAVQVCGALLNLMIFSLLIMRYPQLRATPIIPLAVGAAAGLAFNYAGASLWVFRQR